MGTAEQICAMIDKGSLREGVITFYNYCMTLGETMIPVNFLPGFACFYPPRIDLLQYFFFLFQSDMVSTLSVLDMFFALSRVLAD